MVKTPTEPQGPIIRKPYDLVDRVQLRFVFDKETEPEGYEKCLSMTQQQFKDECDINNIIKQFQVTGVLPGEKDVEPLYADVSDLPSYQEAQRIIQDASDRFEALPSSIRARFDHNPGEFVAFMDNPANIDEAVKLGLASYVKEDIPTGQKTSSEVPEPVKVAPTEADA